MLRLVTFNEHLPFSVRGATDTSSRMGNGQVSPSRMGFGKVGYTENCRAALTSIELKTNLTKSMWMKLLHRTVC